MSKLILKDAWVEVDGHDISDHVRSVTVETSKNEVDLTAMGATFTVRGQGLGDATITCNVFVDYAAGEIDDIMWPLYTSGSVFTVKVKPTQSATVSSTNPIYQLDSQLFTYNPISGAVGEASMTDLTFPNASQTGLTRGTA